MDKDEKIVNYGKKCASLIEGMMARRYRTYFDFKGKVWSVEIRKLAKMPRAEPVC